jgi:hypothetical protein
MMWMLEAETLIFQQATPPSFRIERGKNLIDQGLIADQAFPRRGLPPVEGNRRQAVPQ